MITRFTAFTSSIFRRAILCTLRCQQGDSFKNQRRSKGSEYVPLRPLVTPLTDIYQRDQITYLTIISKRIIISLPPIIVTFCGLLIEWSLGLATVNIVLYYITWICLRMYNGLINKSIRRLSCNKDVTWLSMQVQRSSPSIHLRTQIEMYFKERNIENVMRNFRVIGNQCIEKKAKAKTDTWKGEFLAEDQDRLEPNSRLVFIDFPISLISEIFIGTQKDIKSIILKLFGIVYKPKKGEEDIQDRFTNETVKTKELEAQHQCLIITLEAFEDKTKHSFFLEFKNNKDRKYEDYLMAIGNRQKIKTNVF